MSKEREIDREALSTEIFTALCREKKFNSFSEMSRYHKQKCIVADKVADWLIQHQSEWLKNE